MLPPLIRKTDTVPVYSPVDPAIDLAGSIDLDRWKSYVRGERDALDVATIPLKDGSTPTVFHIRALTARERDIAVSLSLGDLGDEQDGREERVLASTAYLSLCIRLGLESVEHAPEGWDFARTHRYGVSMWEDALLDALDPHTFAFLGLAISGLSAVPLARSAPFGS